MLKIDKISVEEKTFRKSKELDSIIESIKKHRLHDDPVSLLPKAPYYEVSFNLTNTYAGFANDIRRTMVEGLDVIAADVDDSRIKTDDEFVFGTSDVVVKNINLLPVNQELDLEDMEKYTVYLLVANKTTEIIDVNASDFVVGYVEDVHKKNSAKLQKDLGDPSLKKEKSDKPKKKNLKTGRGKSASTHKKSGGKEDNDDEQTEEDQSIETASVDQSIEPPEEKSKNRATVTDVTDEDQDSTKDSSRFKYDMTSRLVKKPARHSMVSTEIDSNKGTTKITEALLARAYNDQEKSVIDIKKIFPNPNICIARLRPGKSIFIESIDFVVGKGSQTMAKFSLLNNIKYQPINVDPYDFFTGKGKRSAEYDPKDFALGFTTAGNITPKKVIKNVAQTLTDAILDIKKHIDTYASAEHKKYYSSDDLIVTLKDDVYSYKFLKHYYTPINMIAQRCFLIDQNVLFCASAVERYDTQAGIIRLKHADPNKLLLKSIEGCLADIKILSDMKVQ